MFPPLDLGRIACQSLADNSPSHAVLGYILVEQINIFGVLSIPPFSQHLVFVEELPETVRVR